MNKKDIFKLILSGVTFVFLVSGFMRVGFSSNNRDYITNVRPVAVKPFDEVEIRAKAAYVFDLAKNEAIFELNPYAQLPLASLTKIMTIIVASERLPQKEIDNLSGLIDAALVSSSNNAAQAIASRAEDFMGGGSFLTAMNRKAKELKLSQTYFLNETGLDMTDKISGAYGSAADVARLIAYAAQTQSDLFEVTTYENVGQLRNTNPHVSSTTRIIASKTGFTDLAEGNLAIVFDVGLNHPVVAVVLGSSKKERFTDIDTLVDATFRYFSANR